MAFPISLSQIARGVWGATTAATRTVTATTVDSGAKTGYSLTAGSYSIRASSCQRGNVSVGAQAQTGSSGISSVTTTRAQAAGGWQNHGPDSGTSTPTNNRNMAYLYLIDGSTVGCINGNNSGINGATTNPYNVKEMV